MIHAQPILDLAALRAIETRHRDADPPLMLRAGQTAAALARRLLARVHGGVQHPPLIVAGPGNNGGDAFVVARLLKQAGVDSVLVFAGEVDKLPADARDACNAWRAVDGALHDDMPAREYSLVIDGLFGIGLTRPLEGRHAALVERINALPCLRLALDIPSGLDSETGCVRGVAVRATHTASFIALKPGLLTLDGPDHCGELSVHDLGLDLKCGADATRHDAHAMQTIAPDLFAAYLQPRRRNTHKGSFGSVGILGGAPGMAGAALLAGRSALHLGTGRVYVGMLAHGHGVDPQQPELMLRPCEEVFALATCLLIGPGLGQSDAALALLRRACDSPLPLLLDADALNLLAAHPVLLRHVARRDTATLLTPHPAEAARLLGTDSAGVQANRPEAARELARRCNAATLLKGCGSIVALPDGRRFFNTTGNPGLASAGSGDVLGGMVAALLAQGWPAEYALLAATHLHGAAADACVIEDTGPVGLTAGELIVPARRLLNRWIVEAATHAL